jgi:hypothetical protein
VPQYQYVHNHEYLCPSCQRKKQRSLNIKPQEQYEEFPYYGNEGQQMNEYQYEQQPQYEQQQPQYEQQQEQYKQQEQYEQQQEQYKQQEQYEQQQEQYEQQQEQYEQQEEPYCENEYGYQENENIDNYEQPRYEYRTFQPRVYSFEERVQLRKIARPLFTVISYGSTNINNLGTEYNTQTLPIQHSEIIQKIEKTQKKQNIQKPKEKIINKEIKEEKKVINTQVKEDKKEIKKVDKKDIKKEEKKESIRKTDEKEKNEVIRKNKEITSSGRYKKRGGDNVVRKKEKIRQSSVNKNDRGKKHHLTYEVVNILVEKEE